MKKYTYLVLSAGMLFSLSACSNVDELNQPDGSHTNNNKIARVYAKAPSSNPETRADITVGNGKFTMAWEEGDTLALLPSAGSEAQVNKLNYNATVDAFEGQMYDYDNSITGKYFAFYPYGTVKKSVASISFGNTRPQIGNDFNTSFDALVAEPVDYAAGDEKGEVNGKPAFFTLHRLTSILNFSINAIPSDIKGIALTSNGEKQYISAASLDFNIATGSSETQANVSSFDQSNNIYMPYNGSNVAESKVEAFFNIPAGSYENLTLDIFKTNGEMATATITPKSNFIAGALYKKDISSPSFTAVTAPTLTWGKSDGKEFDDIHEITVDESGTLTYTADVAIDAPAGIAGLDVVVDSKLLAPEIKDILQQDTALLNIFKGGTNLGVVEGTAVQYKKSVVFDITNLIPLILMFEGESDDVYGEHKFIVYVTDLAGNQVHRALTFNYSKPVQLKKNDLWQNTAVFSTNLPATATAIKVQCRTQGATVWQDATNEGNNTWEIAPTWVSAPANGSNKDTFTLDNTTGIFAGRNYEYQVVYSVDGDQKTYAGSFSTAQGDAIASVSNSGLSCYKTTNTDASFWGSGNNTASTFFGQTDKLCTYSSPYAYLAAKNPLSILAPGNLFTGTFLYTKISATKGKGTVGFGQPFAYKARPSALKLNYKAAFNVDNSGCVQKWPHDNELGKKDTDQASIMVCIINWDARHGVTSGNANAPTDTWSPETLSGLSDVEKSGLIAYGVKYLSSDVDTDTLLEIPLLYYNKDAGIPTGKYTIIISCSTSRYGEYLNGSKNDLYVKDFEWVY